MSTPSDSVFRGTIRIYDGHPTTPQSDTLPWVQLPRSDVHYEAVFDATSGLWLPPPSPEAAPEEPSGPDDVADSDDHRSSPG